MAEFVAALSRSVKRTDVVGISIGGPRTLLVRVARKKDALTVMAVGELPRVELPHSGAGPVAALSDGKPAERVLVVPKPLAAPYAAFAVEHPECVMRIVSLKQPPETDEAAALTELFGSNPPKGFRVGFGQAGAPNRQDRLYLACALPEYVATTAAALLSANRRPAPASLQVASGARLAAFAAGPVRRHAQACVVLMEVEENTTSVAVFHAGLLVAYRQFPIGNGDVVDEVARQFGLPHDLAGEMLCENQIDTSSATHPVLTPLFRQIGLSTEFVGRRESCRVSHGFVTGSIAGTSHWIEAAQRTFGVDVSAWNPLEGYPRPEGVPVGAAPQEQRYHAALGAALAWLEDE